MYVLVLCILTFLSFACFYFFSSSHFVTKHPSLDGICNLIDRSNTDMDGKDCNTDESKEQHKVLQQSFIVCCYRSQCSANILSSNVIAYTHTHRKLPTSKHLYAHRHKDIRILWTMSMIFPKMTPMRTVSSLTTKTVLG
jgi:hypothetical protein